MKSDATSKKFPANAKAWEAVVAAAPGKDRPLTVKEAAALARAVTVKKGGYPAVQAALAAKRKQGQRGPQRSPTKQAVSSRYSPDVLDYFKSTGAGWQTRIDETLRHWIAQQAPRQRRQRSAA
jgi:uncharacterized protein (DUF4415 family)